MELDYVTLSPTESEKILAAGNGEAALVYLYMKATGDTELSGAEKCLRIPAQNLAWAKTILQRLGLLDQPASGLRYDSERAPVYTGEQVRKYSQQDSDFKLLQGEISRRIGRTLSTEDLKILLGLRDYLKLPPEVIMMALTCCIQKNEYYNRSHGGERTVTIRALERECYDWANQGVVTLQQASAHIGKTLQQAEPETQVRKAMGLDHAPIALEKEYITSWLKMGFSTDAIRLAYERTVMGTGKLAWAYMNKILLNWHEENLHTADAVRAGDQKQNNRKNGGSGGADPAEQPGTTPSPFKPGQHEKAAAGNMKNFLDSLKE